MFENKPKIGLNADIEPGINGQRDDRLIVPSRYYECISRAGGIPVVVPPQLQCEDIEDIVDGLDGFVLIGGKDLRRPGISDQQDKDLMYIQRESFDRMLVAVIVHLRMPVLGIGCGMQLLNVACGGTLWDDIRKQPGPALHRNQNKITLHLDATDRWHHRHALMVIKDETSFVHSIYGDHDEVFGVSSAHHQAVRRVAETFKITSVAPDGVIESIESTDPAWTAIGLQFHPELLATVLDELVFVGFVEEVQRRLELHKLRRKTSHTNSRTTTLTPREQECIL